MESFWKSTRTHDLLGKFAKMLTDRTNSADLMPVPENSTADLQVTFWIEAFALHSPARYLYFKNAPYLQDVSVCP